MTKPNPTKPKSRPRPQAAQIHECPRIVLARRLDILADAELQHGHHIRAEQLSWRAADLRGVAR